MKFSALEICQVLYSWHCSFRLGQPMDGGCEETDQSSSFFKCIFNSLLTNKNYDYVGVNPKNRILRLMGMKMKDSNQDIHVWNSV